MFYIVNRVVGEVFKVGKEISMDLIKGIGTEKSKTFEYEGFEIEVKEYLPIEKKRIMVELIVKNAFIYEDERKLSKLDGAIKEVMFDFFIVKYYTNLVPMEDSFEMYDVLKVTGLIDLIKRSIPELEIKGIEDFLEDRIAQEYRLAELESSIGYRLQDTVASLNRTLSESIKAMAEFDPTKLQTLLSFIDEGKKEALNREISHLEVAKK